eukprot:Sdes_comp18264_c0_seq1m7890
MLLSQIFTEWKIYSFVWKRRYFLSLGYFYRYFFFCSSFYSGFFHTHTHTFNISNQKSGNSIQHFEGTSCKNFTCSASFGQNENFVFCPDVNSGGFSAWDSRTAEKLKSFSVHNNVVRCVATNPKVSGFLSCGDDHRARFWKTASF